MEMSSQNSNTGTIYINPPFTQESKKQLSVNEICAIIRLCGKSRVAELKFGDLYVLFGKQTEERQESVATTDFVHTESPLAAKEKAEILQNQIEKDELQLREEQLAFMQVENPVLAEELLIKGELEGGTTQEDS